MKNVLVFPHGSEIGLEIYRSLENSKHFNLIGGSSVHDHGEYVYKNVITLPFIDDKGFIIRLNHAIQFWQIDYIIPAHDSVVLKLAENKVNTEVITSPLETCQICRSKSLTYKIFEGIIPVPSYTEDYPVFLKPDIGQGSKGCVKANNQTERDFYLYKDVTLLPLEYLPGKEYTIDCFTDRHGSLLFAEGRERVRINNGISVNSKPVKDLRFQEMAKAINEKLTFRGVWFFQVKARKSGELVLMEIAPRIAGTMALYRCTGVNFVELSLWDRMDQDVTIFKNDFKIHIDRALSAKYKTNIKYSSLYIDMDDTLIIKGRVNLDLLKLIYKAKGEGKRIFIITKHEGDVFEYLKSYFINSDLFDDILQVTGNKSKYIARDSIFIDDSFAERKEVFDKLNIPVFGIDAIEVLL